MRHIQIVRSKRRIPRQEEQGKLLSKQSWSITRFVGSLAAMTTLAGIVLHGCGHVAYTSYLKAWGVQADLFPQSADWKVVRGYYAIVLQGLGMIRSFPWISVAIALFVVWLAVWIYRLPDLPVNQGLIEQFGRRHPRIMLFLSSGGIAASGIYLALTLFFVGLFVAIPPGLLGEHAGKDEAITEKSRLLGPVSRGDSELWEKGKRKIRGHIIASSSDLIAIYDTDLHQVRTLSRGDWEIRRVGL
ncbi:hypothetical protein [Xanthomonas hortorum]|uniref:Uncharacterized protein n=1 Tax=Xanthomonas hortorum pv. pelargonii TaxID=453602 RepID=A0A6V7CBG5_9XANT|nr:hypothetical protein [Xanthomonas hortorum]MCE4356284.1 hypothetical protein [Xanthomonas hortorum pv. pelargonii]MCM5526081.1 hypothetical protein [Xanthomonas hortorum pv. pelargonii]MCM5538291.1 hypothetical protein [Xanthomonas hortorum pv. pelargonii]MCM5542461.1 hypothetical protein [Xanthomonas hortorum pv. pelargonii]MCM5546235.1 hypothetical protein [Xanthomonas hortorum pv. pelargonii]